jgi:nitroreductase
LADNRVVVELGEALARRRTTRDFLPDPVVAEAVERLLYAADRAPTASNVPYREVIVVDDPRVIRAVKQIHPAMLGTPPLLLVIATNMTLAEKRVGRVGRLSSAIDSGAAGENVLLAATALGLGSQFTMISSMAGIRRVLRLPADYRVDLIIPVGVAAGRAAATKSARAVTSVHHNQHGVTYVPTE